MKNKIKETSESEQDFLKNSKKRIKESPWELKENCRVYNQKFGKSISVDKFKELIEL